MGYYVGQRDRPCPRCGGVVSTLFISVSPMSFSQRCQGCGTTEFTQDEEARLNANVLPSDLSVSVPVGEGPSASAGDTTLRATVRLVAVLGRQCMSAMTELAQMALEDLRRVVLGERPFVVARSATTPLAGGRVFMTPRAVGLSGPTDEATSDVLASCDDLQVPRVGAASIATEVVDRHAGFSGVSVSKQIGELVSATAEGLARTEPAVSAAIMSAEPHPALIRAAFVPSRPERWLPFVGHGSIVLDGCAF